jgi:hypothetical protein
MKMTGLLFGSALTADPMSFDIFKALSIRRPGLEVISIGEPFQSKGYSGWFVPYKIKSREGEIHENNLALSNDHKAQRYVVDGGFYG